MKASRIHNTHTQQEEPETKEIRFRDRHTHISRILLIFSLLFFLGAIALLSFAVRRSIQKQNELTQIVGLADAQSGNIAIAREIYAIMQQLSKVVELPKDELPVYATISDITKLAGQPIFAAAVNGDQILFYTKAQRIFIYRPNTKALVAQGPFVIPSVAPQQNSAPSQSTGSSEAAFTK